MIFNIVSRTVSGAAPTLAALSLVCGLANTANAQLTMDASLKNFSKGVKSGISAQANPLNYYDNTQGTNLGSSGSNPNTNMLGAGTLAGGGGGSIDTVAIAPVNTTGATVSTTVAVSFYSNINLSATAAAPVNTGFIGGFTADFPALATGFYFPTTFTLNTPIVFPSSTFAVKFQFFQLGTTTLLPGASITELINLSGVAVGSSPGFYWRDADASGAHAGSEQRNIGANSNFYLGLGGPTAVPEPGAVALLMGFGVSGAALLRRRRK